MNHRGIVAAQSRRVYDNRNYVLSELDDRYFDALNHDAHICGLNGYCLDAIDEIPQGSMVDCVGHPAERFVLRGRDWVDALAQEQEVAEMVRQILAEQTK